MTRPKENVLTKLKEQVHFLRTSLSAFYDQGEFAESVRIATIIRVLVHETGSIKEEGRDACAVNWMQDLVQDLRFGLRMLRIPVNPMADGTRPLEEPCSC